MFKFFSFIVNAGQIIWGIIKGAIEFSQTLFEYILSGIGFIEYLLVGIPTFAQGFLFALVGIALASLFIGVVIKF